jgi:predicted permease
VLLIACANLAGLMLSRAAARQHELAVRAAIGAGRGRLFRQAIVESLLLALGGAGLGLFVAAGVKVALVRFFPEFDAPLDSGVLLFTMAVALLTAVLCGLLPALHCARIDPALGLQHARGSLAPRLRIGRLLIVLQVALSLWLVIGAGLLLQTIVHLRRIDPGFVANNIVLAGLDPAQAGYSSERAIDLYRRLRGEVAALPGVADVALTSNALIDGGYSTWALQRPGDRQQVSARYVVVSDGFFAMLGIPLRRGREFTPGDRKGAPFVTIVNESLASKLFPGEDALGRSFTIDHHALEIVGICGDARNSSFRRNPPPTFYLSHAQDWSYGPSLLLAVRSGLPTEALVPGIRKVLAAIDATVPLGEVTTLTGRIDHSIRQERMFATLCTALAVLAMLLCCVGLYGLLSYNVARRTHEFGIRLALGANPEKLARPILREGVALASLGAALSLPAVFGLSMLIGKILFGVTPMDVMTIASAIVAMLFVAALAAWLPARRAAKVDPMVALRVE